METKSTLLRSIRFFTLLLPAAVFSSCAHQPDPEAYERDDYFGGHGNLVRPNHHVPREVQRVEPWLPIL